MERDDGLQRREDPVGIHLPNDIYFEPLFGVIVMGHNYDKSSVTTRIPTEDERYAMLDAAAAIIMSMEFVEVPSDFREIIKRNAEAIRGLLILEKHDHR